MSDTTGTDWSTRRHRRRVTIYGSWFPGAILIGLGVVFLAQNYLGTTLRNWWALFILIPAFGSLTAAYDRFRDGDTRAAAGAALSGAGFVFLSGVFLFDLSLGQLWPVFLIIAGIGMLFSRRWLWY